MEAEEEEGETATRAGRRTLPPLPGPTACFDEPPTILL